MLLKKITLQNFRNYKTRSFDFDKTNIIVGKNTAGKTNILESICFLSSGKSFRAENDMDTIATGADFARIEGEILLEDDTAKLTTLLYKKNGRFYKKHLINNIPKKQIDFVSKIIVSLFNPSNIEIITDSPNLRRKYIDSVLCQADKDYRHSLFIYEKALKTRNRMLYFIKEGKSLANSNEFEYWDNLLIENGAVITDRRNNFIAFLNEAGKKVFEFCIYYDKSTITRDRLDKYFEIEQKTGVTLIGPQRDELVFLFPNPSPYTSDGTDERSEGVRLLDKRGGEATTSTPRAAGIASGDARPRWTKTIKEFGSRGEQRLTIFQMKLLEIEFLKQQTSKTPILLLDDIFSELDSENINKVLDLIGTSQTIITTTHKEFVSGKFLESVNVIELK